MLLDEVFGVLQVRALTLYRLQYDGLQRNDPPRTDRFSDILLQIGLSTGVSR
jgi:hypothetical protein